MQLVPETLNKSLENLKEDIGQTFDRWMANLGFKKGLTAGPESTLDKPTDLNPVHWFQFGIPSVDIRERTDDIEVIAELPGLEKEDFTVQVDRQQVLIRGKKKEKISQTHEGVHYQECRYGAFSRALPLPYEVEADRAKAVYKNGVLHITAPKGEKAKQHYVKIDIN